jgi:pimeloyl-ACP methyl ester carboxylesterase
MRTLRVATLAVSLAGVAGGCSFKPIGGLEGNAFAIKSEQGSYRDLAAAEFVSAVYERLAAGRGGFTAAESDLPADTFRALDANRDGLVTRAEWHRPVATDDATEFAAAYKPFAAASFDLAAKGAASLRYEDLDRSLGQHPNRPDGLSPRAFQTAAKGGTMDLKAFEGFYPAITGQTIRGKGLANLLLGPYLKFAGFVGSEFLNHVPRRKITTNPAQKGYQFEETTLTSEDGLSIKAWYVPAERPSSKAAVMVHGHGANRATWIETPTVLGALHDAGYNAVMLDLRRHGESGGEWITMALKEDNDVRAAVRWAQAKGNTAIGLVGNSLGGATSIHAGATTPAVKAVWDDCSFASVFQAISSAAKMLNLPHRELVAPAILETASRRIGEDLSVSQPQKWIAQFGGKPISIVHGAKDPYINAENSVWNFNAAQNPKSLWMVPGAGHGDSSEHAPAEYQKRLVTFFETYVGRSQLPSIGLR